MAQKTLNDLFEETAAANAAEWDRLNTPEKIAEREERRKREFEQGVKLGWWDENGDPIERDDEDEESDEDEEEA